MSRPHLRLATIIGAITALLVASIAEAQWVLLARHAIGRVEQMSQQTPQGSGAGYDTAAVVLEVPADRVYATAVQAIRKAPGISVTGENDSLRQIQFTNGQQVAGIKVSPLGDTLSHLLITSAHTGSQPNAASLVLDNVLRVCKEMKVECSRAQQ